MTSSRSAGPAGNTTNHVAPASPSASTNDRSSAAVPVQTPSVDMPFAARSREEPIEVRASSPTSAMPPHVGDTVAVPRRARGGALALRGEPVHVVPPAVPRVGDARRDPEDGVRSPADPELRRAGRQQRTRERRHVRSARPRAAVEQRAERAHGLLELRHAFGRARVREPVHLVLGLGRGVARAEREDRLCRR